VLVFTTLPKGRAIVRQVCYRLQGQIKLTFKRLKSIVDLGNVPQNRIPKQPCLAIGEAVRGVLSQKLARVGSAISPWGYYLPQQASDKVSMA